MVVRLLKTAFIGILATIVVESLPDLARYLRLREM